LPIPPWRERLLSLEKFEPTALAIIAECADDAFAVLQQRDDANLHVNIDALVHAVVLQRANHFQPGAIAHVREPRIFVSAEIP
jgi:hypothetical protein